MAEVVRKQAEVGVDVPSDGEFGKISWTQYVVERLDGIERREQPAGGGIYPTARIARTSPNFTRSMTRSRPRCGSIRW